MLEIPREQIAKYTINLIKDETKLKYLLKERGITKDTVIQYEIGFDLKTSRFTIPIRSEFGIYCNVKKWSKGGTPKVLNSKGSEAWVYPYENTKQSPLIICEGEWDCLLLNQYGFNAVTNTCGVATWKDDWNRFLDSKDVIIIFDCDNAGRESAKTFGKKIVDIVNNLKIIDLGLNDHEDITDWFVKYKKTDDELLELIRKTEPEDLYDMVDLSKAMDTQYVDKKIKFSGIVIGKDLSPFLVPKKIEAICHGERSARKCNTCPLGETEKPIMRHEFTYERDKSYIIKMLNSSDEQITGLIKKCLRVPTTSQCRHASIEVTERQIIENIKLIPEISFDLIDQDYVIRKCFYFGKDIKTNQSYLCRGTTFHDPSNQEGIHLIKEVKGYRDSISKFVFDGDAKKLIKPFQAENNEDEYSILEKLKDIHKDMSANVTHMYERDNVIMATELVYHSVINFNFNAKRVMKGWLECTILGDTRCGKTETVRNLLHHYRAGEFITSAENTTPAGLLGGAQQTHSGRWTLTWGKIPLNDQGMLIIDEFTELCKSDGIATLSGVRSSGIAELVKIQSQRTNARTRMIFIVNPIHGKMSEHNYGIEVLRELFKAQQDISRIDFCVAVSREDVPDEVINSAVHDKYPHKYTTDMFHTSVMRAWNIKPNQVIITKDATDLILDLANEFGKKYSADIPLIIGAEMRIKLARMAVALATFMYSTDDTDINVVVHPAHVLVISKFLQKNYDHHNMGYNDFSDQKKREKSLAGTDRLDDIFHNRTIINMFLDSDNIQLHDMEDMLECEFHDAKRYASELRKLRALKKVNTYYKKTSSFIEYLKQRKQKLGDKF